MVKRFIFDKIRKDVTTIAYSQRNSWASYDVLKNLLITTGNIKTALRGTRNILCQEQVCYNQVVDCHFKFKIINFLAGSKQKILHKRWRLGETRELLLNCC